MHETDVMDIIKIPTIKKGKIVDIDVVAGKTYKITDLAIVNQMPVLYLFKVLHDLDAMDVYNLTWGIRHDSTDTIRIERRTGEQRLNANQNAN